LYTTAAGNLRYAYQGEAFGQFGSAAVPAVFDFEEKRLYMKEYSNATLRDGVVFLAAQA
jgi:hypothetical protein